jgi:hypothetical protein
VHVHSGRDDRTRDLIDAKRTKRRNRSSHPVFIT